MKDDGAVAEGVVDLTPTFPWDRGISLCKQLLIARPRTVSYWEYFRSSFSMQIVWHVKVIGLALFILNWRPILHTLLQLFERQRVASIALIVILQAAWILLRRTAAREEAQGEDTKPPPDERLTPCFFECRTTHTRLFPTSHSFSYSYLLVGVPVGWRGSTSKLLSSDLVHGASVQSWFSVHAQDYLERGTHPEGLAGKLKEYLASQHVSVDDYPHAYLVTAPRFLGFSFNPVSFWYLYDEQKTLSAMILEVNNTFDERRMYFLPRTATDHEHPVGKFCQQWNKDFHVSPFNDREGSYSLSAVDPFENTKDQHVQIDNNIVLRANDGKAKVVARVFTSSPGRRPADMSTLSTYLFIARWWWVGFMTNPRILREARILWVKGLQVFYRPEVFKTSIGRTATREEDIIEPFFRSLLHSISNVDSVTIKYSSAANDAKQISMVPEKQTGTQLSHASQPLEIKILTPEFYSELARDPNVFAVLERSCFNAGAGQAMVDVSDPKTLRTILEKCDSEPRQLPVPELWASGIEFLRRGLRNSFSEWLQRPTSLQQKRSFAARRGVDLDEYVHATFDSQRVREFEVACFKTLLADRIAFGFTSLLRFYTWLMWLALLLSTVFHLNSWLHRIRDDGIWGALGLGLKMITLLALG